MTHPTPALVDIEELERQLSDILTAHAHYQDVFFGPTIAAASHNSLALLAELRALRAELAELRSQANEYGAVNVNEHGDHPAPAGHRFCSVSCEQCEHAGDDGCSGLCAFSAPTVASAELERDVQMLRHAVEYLVRLRPGQYRDSSMGPALARIAAALGLGSGQ